MPEVVRFAMRFSPYAPLDSLFGKKGTRIAEGNFQRRRFPEGVVVRLRAPRYGGTAFA